MTEERMRVVVNDDELRNLIPLLDELIFKKTLVTGEGMDTLKNIETEAEWVEAQVQATVDRLTVEITAVQVQAEQLEMSLESVLMGMPLPTVDRATRMILLRIPGLREALRTLYQISMLRRTLALGDVRGPITAAVTILVYLSMTMAQMQRRQNRVEAKLEAMERDMDLRFITMEEAVRGYGDLPQRYRSGVIS